MHDTEAGLYEAGLGPDEDTVLDGVTSDRRRTDDRAAEVQADIIVQRMAANLVRRQCDQHACQGSPCQHPGHDRDVDYLRHCLAFLGLPEGLSRPSKEERKGLLANLPSITPLGTNKPGR